MANIFDEIFDEIDAGTFDPAKDAKPAAPSLGQAFGSAMDEIVSDAEQSRNGAIFRASKSNPDKYPDLQALGGRYGFDADFAGRNEEALRGRALVDDLRSILDENPELADWYSQDDNPAAIKIDELRQLSGLSWLWRSASSAFQAGGQDVDLANLRYRQMMGVATNDEVSRADLLGAAREPRSYGADTWLEKGWTGAAQQLPIMGEAIFGGLSRGVEGAAYGATIAALAGQAGPQIATPEELVTVPAGMATGYAVGAVAGQWEASFRLEAGLAFDEFLDFRDEEGKAIDPDIARVAALISGASGAMLEVYGVRKLGELVPGLDRLTGTFGRNAVREALARPSIRDAFKNFATNTFKAGVTEVATEIGQEAITMFAGEMAKVAAEGATGAQFEGMDASEITSRLAEIAEKTAQSMTILGPVLSGTRLGADIQRARMADQQRALIEALNEHAAGNEMNTRIPDRAKAAVAALTENGPVKSVFIQPEALATYFQENYEEVAKFARSINAAAEVTEGLRTGRDIEIPIETYYTSIAGTEIGNALADATKLSQDVMSTAEAEVFNEAWSEAQAALESQYDAEQAANRVELEGEELIFEDVKNRAMDAGIVPDQARQYGTLYSTFFRVMAQRTGQDMGELYARYGLEIKRALPGEREYSPVDNLDLALEVIRRGRIDPLRKRVEKAAGPSLIDAIVARGGIEDVGGDLASMDVPARLIRPKPREFNAGLWTGSEAETSVPASQYSADDTARQMWEEGYFPDFQDRPSSNDLLDAISEELSGNKRYSAHYDQRQADDIASAAALVAFADMLDASGLDPSTMDNEAIRAEVDRLINEDAETGALFQATSSQNTETIEQLEERLEDYYDLKSLSLFENGDTIKLNMIAIDRDKQGGGIGSAVMREIIAYADANNKTVTLTTGQNDDAFGTTSSTRLKKFYKRFGFVENKGRNKDFSLSGNMYRLPALYQGDEKKQVKRGSIQFGDGQTVINMFDQADLSTFLHESGHFFLQVFSDLASDPNGPAELLADWEITKEYLGIDGNTIPVEAHEKFARTFEAYLFEGNAPSEEIAGIMSRFRSWLLFVYQSVKNLDVPINGKIRGVMDRMLASEEEIAAKSTQAEFRPAFTDAASAGMTESQWQEYRAMAGRAVERARRDLDARMMQEIARETTSEWKATRRELTDAVAKEYSALPVYRAINYLRTGKDSDVTGDRLHMDRAGIVSIMGEGGPLKMPKGTYRNKGGVHPDVIADLFGFRNGHDMLTKMISVTPREQAIAEEVDLRMRRKFGDLMGDAVARSRAAEDAIANDATGDLLNAELSVLVKNGLVTTKINKAEAQRTARAMIRSKTIREAIRQKLYMNANAKAAAEAERAIIAGDWKTAVAAKQRQLLNHYLAIEARQAERDTEQAVSYLNRFTGRKRPKSIDPEYLDQIDTLLERFDFRKSVTLKDAQRRQSLSAWIEEQEAAGNIVQIPDALRNDAFRKPYREMTVDDLLTVVDAVKNIEHLGRLKDKLLAAKERREFEAVRDELVAAVSASQERRKSPATRNPTKIDKLFEFGRSLEATLLKIEQVFDWMDGGDINGPFRRYIWKHIADAEARENSMRLEYTGKFVEILGELDKARLSEVISIPGLDQSFQRSEIMAVALNMGNEGNLDKMLRGEAWTPETLDTIVAHLDEKEWQAVQKIWDTINELWPEIAALQKRLTGVEPPKVEPREVETKYGVMRGGYYPLIYDPRRSADVEDRRAASNDTVKFENTYLRPETRHGFTKERTRAYTRPLLFDLDGAGAHITAVIHDLTHREAIMDANKLMTNQLVRAEIETRYSPEVYKQLVPWLQSIAHDAYKNDGLEAAERLFKGIRTRSTIMGMGFRISTILTQLAGYSSALEIVSAKHMAGAIKDFTLSPRGMWEEVNRLSGEMRFRSASLDRDIRDQMRTLTGKNGIADQARRFAFYGIGFMDRMVTVPSWMAAYRQHLAENPGDTEGAAAFADKAIRLSQGSGGAKDLAAVQRRNELTKLVTMFYSYFSAYYNRQRTWGRDAKKALQSGEYKEFPELLARQVFMTIGPAVVAELLVGRGPSDDEGWSEWMARKIAFYPVSAVPVVRDAIGVFDRGFGYQFTPAARAIDEMLIQPFMIVQDLIEGDFEMRKGVKQGIETTGYVLNLPAGQVASSVDNVWKALEEDDFKLRDLVLTRQRD